MKPTPPKRLEDEKGKIMARLRAVKRKMGSVPEGFLEGFLSESQHYPLCGVPVPIDSYCNDGFTVI